MGSLYGLGLKTSNYYIPAASYLIPTLFGSDLIASWSVIWSAMYSDIARTAPIADGEGVASAQVYGLEAGWLEQASIVNRPLYNAADANYNNQPSISGDSDRYMAMSFSGSYVAPHSLIALFNADNVVNFTAQVDIGVGPVILYTFSSNFSFTGLNNVNYHAANTNINSHVILHNGASSSGYLNGGTPTNGDMGAAAATKLEIMAYLGGASAHVGEFAEVALINRIITAAEINQVLARWQTEYGIGYTPV